VKTLAAIVLAALIPAAALPASLSVVSQTSGSTAELRGIAVRDATHAWATGAGGAVLRTRDGKTWEKVAIPDGGDLDYRDVAALTDEVVVLLACGPGGKSRVYRSTDAGKTWKLVHTNPDADGFYDAFAFWDDKNGILVGDPVKGNFQILLTSDGGATWTLQPPGTFPPAFKGEGLFAASGTCLIALPSTKRAWFVTGGARVSRVFQTLDGGHYWNSFVTPLAAGNPSSGLFSVAFLDEMRGVVVGGDYKDPKKVGLNAARCDDGGRKWTPAPISAAGFYSAVVAVGGGKDRLVAVGPVGIAVSDDAGKSWIQVDATPLNAAAFAGPDAGWAVGTKGTIVRLTSSRR